ncbi:hypothetical protein TCAL_12265 [Tigriopus californicus]|uniref:Calcium-activated chloride channel N-terminal domain-containing protein n=1 Tax=Tigriopus californicus TaxID=6832 RepID=A0A553N8K5_TIGCA|nr:hypothetical protein TCAL_12265 [Tigriopus californicus]
MQKLAPTQLALLQRRRRRPSASTSRTTFLLAVIAFIALLLGENFQFGCCGYTTSRIYIEPDGGYSGIAIRIQDSVPEERCAEVLRNLKVVLSSASKRLHQALDERAYFKDITVIVPRNWRDSTCQTPIAAPMGGSTFVDPDILVGKDDPIHGHSIFTQQSRSCGQRGDFMFVPYLFLTSLNDTWSTWGDPGKTFVHEWSKLRYGVFDEYGFVDDPLYPNYYKVQGAIIPTGTSNVPVSGSWRDPSGAEGCDPTTKSCFFQPDLGANDQVTCSLGTYPFLPKVSRYCTVKEALSGSHGTLPPTKHNALCQGRSALDVIYQNDDFYNKDLGRNGGGGGPKIPEPKFTVVRDPQTSYVLLMDASSSMIHNDVWRWVSKAAQKFIRYDLNRGARMALVSFSDSAVVAHPMITLEDDKSRRRLSDTIPDKYKVQRNSDKRCVICGIQTALRSVLRGSEAGAHIILVSKGDNLTLSLTDENTILEHARTYNIKFSNILVPGRHPALSFYDLASKTSGGKAFVFPSPERRDAGARFYAQLISAFQEVLRLDSESPSEIPVRVHTELAFRTNPLLTRGKFTIDTTLGRSSQFGILVNDADDHFMKSVTFFDKEGQTFGPYNSFSSDFNVINLKTINFPHDTTSPPFDDPAHLGMTWQYTLEWYPGGDTSQENVILVESKPRSLGSFGLIDIKMWTNSDSASDLVTYNHPLTMYVQVRRGDSPVLQANVLVDVYMDTENGTQIEVSRGIRLFDSGNGDPDLVGGDGIYSRYLTTYETKGRYYFVINADDNENRAYTIQRRREKRAMTMKPPNLLYPVCCGSQISVPDGSQMRTGSFKRQESGPVLHLISVPDKASDKMPPSRIVNLRLNIIEDERKVTALWTAPGDDFDSGSVQRYKLMFSENVEDLIDPERQATIIHSVDGREDESGTSQQYRFTFDHFDVDYHVAMFAIDDMGNQGNISNIAQIHMPKPESYIEDSQNAPIQTDNEETDWSLIGIIIGVVLTLLILLIVGCYLYFLMAHRRSHYGAKAGKSKSSGVNANMRHPDVSDSGSTESESKNTSSHHLVPQINTISNAYKKQLQVLESNGPAKKDSAAEITPTYWSASQLLKEHEERQRRESTLNRDGSTLYSHPIPELNESMDATYQEDPYGTHAQNGYYNAAMDPGIYHPGSIRLYRSR